jgi:OmpA-OmpF porin, OOP family
MASPRTWAPAAVAVAVVTLAAHPAVADPYQLGGFFGPRFFSEDAELGAKDDFKTSLETSVAFGPRLARPLFRWFVPELEIPFTVATTRDLDVSVFWIEPRAHARFVWPQGKVRPFGVLGFGVPMTASEKRGIYGSDISWEPYSGIGALFTPGRGLSFRFDVRVGITDGHGEDTPIAAEIEATLGLYVELEGGRPVKAKKKERVAKPGDADGDLVVDADDQCPDRAEDEDGFADTDGCPDIDNDMDQVLDIADACPSVPESYNGFEDDDGCQDSIPGDVQTILGTVEGLLYNPGSTDVPKTANEALDKIAAVLEKFPSVKVVFIGHTDDREAEIEPVDGEAPEETAARLADALGDLSRERATAVGAALAERGVARTRIKSSGKGGDEPVSDNDSPRKRLRNRRVEVQLYVPLRGEGS